VPESRPISVRAPADLHERIESLAERDGVTKSQWVITALEIQVEANESADIHTPSVVRDSLPSRVGLRVRMPEGVVRPMR